MAPRTASQFVSITALLLSLLACGDDSTLCRSCPPQVVKFCDEGEDCIPGVFEGNYPCAKLDESAVESCGPFF